MLAQLFAISSASLGAMFAIFTKRGLAGSNTISGLFVSTIVMTLGFWIFAVPSLLTTRLTPLAILAFIADGVVSTVFARLFMFIAFGRVGTSVAMSVVGSQPLFSALFAVTFLHERLTIPLLAGTVFIVLGIAILSEGNQRQDWRKRDLIFPMSAAILFGLASVLKKMGLNEVGSPIVGSAINTGAAFLVIMVYLLFTRKKSVIKLGRGNVRDFSLAGMFQIAMIFTSFGAIWLGNVVEVVPLINTSPLFTVFFSYFLLREIERVTIRILAGAVLIVLGAAFVVL